MCPWIREKAKSRVTGLQQGLCHESRAIKSMQLECRPSKVRVARVAFNPCIPLFWSNKQAKMSFVECVIAIIDKLWLVGLPNVIIHLCDSLGAERWWLMGNKLHIFVISNRLWFRIILDYSLPSVSPTDKYKIICTKWTVILLSINPEIHAFHNNSVGPIFHFKKDKRFANSSIPFLVHILYM